MNEIFVLLVQWEADKLECKYENGKILPLNILHLFGFTETFYRSRESPKNFLLTCKHAVLITWLHLICLVLNLWAELYGSSNLA